MDLSGVAASFVTRKVAESATDLYTAFVVEIKERNIACAFSRWLYCSPRVAR